MAEGLFLPIYKCGYLLTSADYDQLFVDYEFTIHSQKEQCRPTDPSSLHIQSSQYPGYCQVKYCFREKLASSMIIRRNMAIATKEGSFYPKTIINTIVEELEEDTRSVAMTMHQLLTPILGQGFYLSSDLVPAIEYSEWPDDGTEWIHRKRNSNWPSENLISKITSSGCHLVPKPHPLSIDGSEWRYSFSVTAEIPLARSLSKYQRFSFLIIKLMIKCFRAKCSTVVSTYYLKTTLFWLCEEIPITQWTDKNISLNTMKLLDKFIKFLENGNLPNYFIHENNMISHLPSSSKDFQRTLRLIKLIRKDPISALLECDSLTFYSNKIFQNLFCPVLNRLYENEFKYEIVIAALSNVMSHHLRFHQYGYLIPIAKDLEAYFIAWRMETSYEVLPVIATLAMCYSYTNQFEELKKYQNITLRLLEENENTPLQDMSSALINSAQISFVTYETCRTQKHVENTAGLFLIAKHFSTFETSQPCFSSWNVHYANFCIAINSNEEALKLLKENLSVQRQVNNLHKLLKQTIEIAPWEYKVFDQYIESYFQVKQRQSINLKEMYDRYTDIIEVPNIILTYYLLVVVLQELRTHREAEHLLNEFNDFVNTNMTSLHIIPLDTYNLIAHSYLRLGNFEMVEYWFDKCYQGRQINCEINAYHNEITTVLKFSQIYENCFMDL